MTLFLHAFGAVTESIVRSNSRKQSLGIEIRMFPLTQPSCGQSVLRHFEWLLDVQSRHLYNLWYEGTHSRYFHNSLDIYLSSVLFTNSFVRVSKLSSTSHKSISYVDISKRQWVLLLTVFCMWLCQNKKHIHFQAWTSNRYISITPAPNHFKLEIWAIRHTF